VCSHQIRNPGPGPDGEAGEGAPVLQDASGRSRPGEIRSTLRHRRREKHRWQKTSYGAELYSGQSVDVFRWNGDGSWITLGDGFPGAADGTPDSYTLRPGPGDSKQEIFHIRDECWSKPMTQWPERCLEFAKSEREILEVLTR
jgi:hypothetical protein